MHVNYADTYLERRIGEKYKECHNEKNGFKGLGHKEQMVLEKSWIALVGSWKI